MCLQENNRSFSAINKNVMLINMLIIITCNDGNKSNFVLKFDIILLYN